jgi:hypothetical protein
MPNLSPITVTDRADPTPVGHVFNPHSEDNGIAVFSKPGSTLMANKLLTISSVENGTKVKTRVKLALPVTQTEILNNVSRDVVVRTSYADVTFTFDKSSTAQERSDTVGMLSSVLAANQADVDPVVTGLEKWY